jgi:antitoxin (DNA-binding transcriptional repressor) of toxin-antitoxin stability system
MDFEELKKFSPKNGERYIIIENGKPVMVLVSFEDYQKYFHNPTSETQQLENEKTAPLFSNETSNQNSPNNSLETTKKDLTIEDLPF